MESVFPRNFYRKIICSKCRNCSKCMEKIESTYHKDISVWHEFKTLLYFRIFGITVNKYIDVENIERNKKLKVGNCY